MKARYEGDAGKRLLIEALKQQVVVQHNLVLAEQLAEVGLLVEFKVGESLMTQNDIDNSVFFNLSGMTSVFINGRHIADRGAREIIGEMAFLDPSAPRAATVTAKEPVTALKVLEADFHRVADAHPTIWRALALVMAERLRQRNRFHRLPNERPVMFVGSSTEGLSIAKHLQLGLKHSPVEVRLWTIGLTEFLDRRESLLTTWSGKWIAATLQHLCLGQTIKSQVETGCKMALATTLSSNLGFSWAGSAVKERSLSGNPAPT